MFLLITYAKVWNLIPIGYKPYLDALEANGRTTVADGNRSISKGLIGTEFYHFWVRTVILGFRDPLILKHTCGKLEITVDNLGTEIYILGVATIPVSEAATSSNPRWLKYPPSYESEF